MEINLFWHFDREFGSLNNCRLTIFKKISKCEISLLTLVFVIKSLSTREKSETGEIKFHEKKVAENNKVNLFLYCLI